MGKLLAFFIATSICFTIQSTSALKCICSECENSNYTCTTNDGACLTMRDQQYHDIVYQYCAHKPDDLKYCYPSPLDDGFDHSCCYTDMCNIESIVEVPLTTPTVVTRDSQGRYDEQMAAIFTPGRIFLYTFTSVFYVTIFIIFIWKRCCHSKHHGNQTTELSLAHCNVDISKDSGSSKGLPLLSQQRIAKQITLTELVGDGRYGLVFKAQWHGSEVAVKKFKSGTDGEASWIRETEIYQTLMFRHENILGFIASDLIDVGIQTELWIITEYHENGSLYDYLSNTTVDETRLLTMVQSIINGLLHLHTEIIGTQSKPSMAHRDIKSRNILVKTDGTCCIADLGLAVRRVQATNLVDIPDTSLVGTTRYLSPEFLMEGYTTQCLDVYKASDIYAFGLVLWEMVRRCETRVVHAHCYELPYYDRVVSNPSVDEMRIVVCENKARPQIAETWKNDDVLSKLSEMMVGCWREQANGRITALRIKKSVVLLIKNTTAEP